MLMSWHVFAGEWNQGPLAEQQVLLTVELLLLMVVLIFNYKYMSVSLYVHITCVGVPMEGTEYPLSGSLSHLM